MKKSKKVITSILGFALIGTLLSGCANNKTSQTSTSSNEVQYTIGIGQFAQHGSLDNCREGFIEGLKEAGIEEGKNLKIVTDNANSDTNTAAQITASYVSQGVDLICAIATPMAQSAYGATITSKIPVIYTAVTDPVTAGIANEDGSCVGAITGTSDKLPIEQQLQMIRTVLPEAKTIGIMYTTSETNSIAAIEIYKEKAKDYGFELVECPIATQVDVPLAAENLIKKVDCITNITDNTVVSALPVILEKAKEQGIPVFGSEIEQVKIGCLAAVGLEYFELGKQTGAMAAKVLKGEVKAEELPYEVIHESKFYGNTAVEEQLGIPLPEELTKDAAQLFTTIEVD